MFTANWLLALFTINEFIFNIYSQKNSKKLDKKWESLRQPLLRKKALALSQKQMLNVLGLDEIPHRNRRVEHPHKFMLDLYSRLSRGAKRWKSKGPARGIINTVRGLVDQDIHDGSMSTQHHQIYEFDMSTNPTKDDIVSAELRILRQPLQNNDYLTSQYGTTFKAVIYGRKKLPFIARKTLEALDSFTFDITENKESWHVLSVTKTVQKWHELHNSHNYLELRVQALLNGAIVNPVLLGFKKEKRAYRKRALLVLFANDDEKETQPKSSFVENPSKEHWMDVAHSHNIHSRVKRGLRRRRRRHQCRVKPLPVDFTQLDWNSWVIAPQGYDAGICEGACKFPLEAHLRPTNHATVQTILNTVDPLSAPPVCCIPNKLGSLGILYTDPAGVIVYKTYKNMIVERCGCS